MEKLSVGDVVMIKCGGPPMTVLRLFNAGGSGEQIAVCGHFEEYQSHLTNAGDRPPFYSAAMYTNEIPSAALDILDSDVCQECKREEAKAAETSKN